MTLIQNKDRIDDEAVKKLEYAFSIGADVSAACFYADISRRTYYNWISSFPDLEERFHNLRECPALRAFETISKNLDNADTAKWYLERKKKNEFSTKTETDVNAKYEVSGFNFIKNENNSDNQTDTETGASLG